MADYRPNWMAFILYVGPQTVLGSSIVAGSQVTVTPDGRGGTQQTTSTVDVSCCKQGTLLTQSHIQPDGSIAAYSYKPATQNDWNRALAQWQQQLAASYQQGLASSATATAVATASKTLQDSEQTERSQLQVMTDSLSQMNAVLSWQPSATCNGDYKVPCSVANDFIKSWKPQPKNGETMDCVVFDYVRTPYGDLKKASQAIDQTRVHRAAALQTLGRPNDNDPSQAQAQKSLADATNLYNQAVAREEKYYGTDKIVTAC